MAAPKFRPVHALGLILLVSATVLVADFALEGGFGRESYQLIKPDPQGRVMIDLAGLGGSEVRFFRFLNPGNQEVRFFVGRDPEGHVHVAFDANEVCYKSRRGYRAQDGWMVCNKCDKSFVLKGVNEGGGGCSPAPLAHDVEGGRLILAERDILEGWRFFR